jgi:hypothetical protein
MQTRTRIAVVVLAVAAVFGFSSGAQGTPTAPAELPAAALVPPPAGQQPPSENSYVPIAPCRILDTRAGTTTTGSTPFAPLAKRVVYVGSTGHFEEQGGKPGGCGIPVGAVAISASFLVVSPTGAGRIHAWPNNGSPEPTATTYYYGNHTGSASATVTINPLSAYSLLVRNYSATTDLVIDVSGYYVKPLAAVVHPDGSLYSGSSRAIASTRVGVGQYRVKFDRYVRNCTVTAGGYAADVRVGVNQFTYAADNLVELRVYDPDGDAYDQFANVHVIC